jgi:hypothetical protein
MKGLQVSAGLSAFLGNCGDRETQRIFDRRPKTEDRRRKNEDGRMKNPKSEIRTEAWPSSTNLNTWNKIKNLNSKIKK